MSLQNMTAYYDCPPGKGQVTLLKWKQKIWVEFFMITKLKQTHLANDLKPLKYPSNSTKIKAMFVNFLTAHFMLPQGTWTCSKLSNL